MQQPIRIISRSNKRLYADAIPGHFATNHSHINYYIDMSEIKHNMAMALEAARSIAFRFSPVSIDTLLCLEGTEYIGAYVARELANSGIGSLNTIKVIYLVEPDSNVNGQPAPHDRAPQCAGVGQHGFHWSDPFADPRVH